MERISENDIQQLSRIYAQQGKVEIFKVREIRTGRTLCMKKIFVNSISEATDMQRECITMATLTHNNIVPIIAASLGGKDNQITHILIFSEFYEEGDLQSLIQKKTDPFPEFQLIIYLNQLLDALAFMQDKDIAHRDIKPQNIFVSNNGQDLKLGDLGSAIKTKSGIKDFTGTPLYLSPKLRELFQRGNLIFDVSDNSFKSDVYSLGLTFLYMASLRDPKDLTDLNTLPEKIYQRLNQTQENYPYLTSFLRMMLAINEHERPDFVQLQRTVGGNFMCGSIAVKTIPRLVNPKVQQINAKCSICDLVKRDEEQYLYNGGVVCFDCIREFQASCQLREMYHFYINVPHAVGFDGLCQCGLRFCTICKFEHGIDDVCFNVIKNVKYLNFLGFACPECREFNYLQERVSFYCSCNNGHYFCCVCLDDFNRTNHRVCKKLLMGYLIP